MNIDRILSNKRNLILIGIGALVFLIVLLSTLFTVQQTQQAIVLQFGSPKREIKDPGLHAKIPFVQNVVYFDARVLPLDPPVERVILADQKPLLVDAYARYRIDDPLRFLQSVGNETTLRNRLNPIVTAAMRGVLAKNTLPMVLEDREKIIAELHREVNAAAKPLGIDVIDVRIRRADLPDETSQAVYARMRTEREREAAEFRAQGFERAQQIRSTADREATVIRAEANKESEIQRGVGDGEAAKIFNRALSADPSFYEFYRSMQAYREALHPGDTTYILSPQQGEFFENFRGTGKR